MSLEDRLKGIAEGVAERERRHAADMAHAAEKLGALRETVAGAIEVFNATVAPDVPHLSIDVSPVRLDEKHLHAHEFELARGRHRALVIAKSKSEFTLVGPFRTGKSEGPCRTFPFSAASDLEDAMEDFLERFLEEATAP